MIQMLTPEDKAHLDEFLRPRRIAVVATVGIDGISQLTPNWYRFAGGKLTISTTKERIKYRNLMRNDLMTVCVYSEPLAMEYVTITGRAEIIEGESIWQDTQAIVERYIGPERLEIQMGRMHTQDRIIISLVPARVYFGQARYD